MSNKISRMYRKVGKLDKKGTAGHQASLTQPRKEKVIVVYHKQKDSFEYVTLTKL